MTKKKKEFTLAEKVLRQQKALEAGKRAYKRSDRLMKEILKEAKAGEEIVLNAAGRKAVIRDKFADVDGKGVIWTPAAARRWEVEIIEA